MCANQGNVARNNSFSDIKCQIVGRSVEGCGGGVQAVYLDDQMSGWRWENNRFEDCDTGFFIGGGRSTIATGNHFERCDWLPLSPSLFTLSLSVPATAAPSRSRLA